MPNEVKTIDPLPGSFKSEEVAGEFWDTHSLTDYKEHLEATDDVTFEISERVFDTQVYEADKREYLDGKSVRMKRRT